MNKNIFFIVSAARSRSTWFANLFTYKNTFCFNEELRYCKSFSDLKQKILSRKEDNVGVSDPEILHYIEFLPDIFPDAKYLFLDRNLNDCLNSLHTITQLPKTFLLPKFKIWEDNINYFKNNFSYHSILFDKMDDINEVKKSWEYILPELTFDIDRFNLLSSMVIKVTIADKPFPPVENCLSVYFDYKKFKLIENEKFKHR